MSPPEVLERTPKSRLERVADHAIWWAPALATLPANLLLPEADFLTRVVVGLLTMAIVALLLGSKVRRRRLERLERDIDRFGVIDCAIRYPRAAPGSLRSQWETGAAELKRGTVTFWPANVMEPFGSDLAGGRPKTLHVESVPEKRDLNPQERRPLRRRQLVVAMHTDTGEVELAADALGLAALLDLVFGRGTRAAGGERRAVGRADQAGCACPATLPRLAGTAYPDCDSPRPAAGPGPAAPRPVQRGIMEEVDVTDVVSTAARIPAAHVQLEGNFRLPAVNAPVVVFAHGSGSGRHSPRNQCVASVLHRSGLGTLLLDLLTPDEAEDRRQVFDIPKLAQRLTAAEAWVHQQPESMSSPVGFFGASTGAGAALWAAAEPGARVGAVASRGGRPDLAGPRLGSVEAPTLLVVGGNDHQVLELNRQAQGQLRCENRLEVVEGATHLFEEPGTLEQAAGLARDWFLRHLPHSGVVDAGAVP